MATKEALGPMNIDPTTLLKTSWMNLSALGFGLYKDCSMGENLFVLVSNGSPVSHKTEKVLTNAGFSKTETGFTGKMSLRTSAVLAALPGAEKVSLSPSELDYQAYLAKTTVQREAKDPMIGRKWPSTIGEREVIGSCKPGIETIYRVKTQGQKLFDWYLASELEQVIAMDQDPATKWRKWQVLNPLDQIDLPTGYEECHIFKSMDQKIFRVAGKPVSIPGYENFSFFLARQNGRWNVFEKTTGLSVTSSSTLKTRKEASSLAKDFLDKHTGSAEKLSALLSTKLLIPQPGQIALPSAKQKDFTLPDLQSHEAALQWLEEKTAQYGSKSALCASAEYKAVHSTITRLHHEAKEEQIHFARLSVADAGLASGDQVVCLSPDKTSDQYGQLYFANTGMPRVRVHTEHSSLGGHIPCNTRQDWHEGWIRATPHTQEEITGATEPDNAGAMAP